MWCFTTPPEIPSYCPACFQDLDPETYVLAWCGDHRPSSAGSADALAKAAVGAGFLTGTGEAGGPDNAALCAAIHGGPR